LKTGEDNKVDAEWIIRCTGMRGLGRINGDEQKPVKIEDLVKQRYEKTEA